MDGVASEAVNYSKIFRRLFPTKKEWDAVQIQMSKDLAHAPNEFASKCLFCGESLSGPDKSQSLCDSHSIPKHSLKAISDDGKLVSLKSLISPINGLTDFEGVGQAGTFRLICRRCDNLIFRDYEDFQNYTDDFVSRSGENGCQKIFNEIAMKNYLYSIYQQNMGIRMFKALEPIVVKANNSLIGEMVRGNLEKEMNDKRDYERYYAETKRLSEKTLIRNYYVGFYRIIPWTVPVAFQDALAVEISFDGTLINNVRDLRAKIQQLQLCIFPDKDRTILLAFSKQHANRLTPIYRYLNRLDDESAVKAVIALALRYSANVYISTNIEDDSVKTDYMRELASDNGTTRMHFWPDDLIPEEKAAFWSNQQAQQIVSEHDTLRQYSSIPDVLVGIDNY
ncbi:hypothetical protein OZX62_05160 [Bifidobacterium sp. ESL0690]|uniref:hypothetical protein n=1 Tax=Bifidobacterium sp. ESL0690 TaxID=2983214 RepID=UPI0023F97E47|nr:hypothetical protein [Bifidobacterium sp. ESL0690]WEV47651.1 hypothetical protein OZX62_05160 [Bifidobacterium sp. ESL0690]